MANKQDRVAALHIFRQFAWNLAGTLATSKAGQRPLARPAGKR